MADLDIALGIKEATSLESERAFIHNNIRKMIRHARCEDSVLNENEKDRFTEKLEVLESKLLHRLDQLDRKKMNKDLLRIRRDVYDNTRESLVSAERGVEVMIMRTYVESVNWGGSCF